MPPRARAIIPETLASLKDHVRAHASELSVDGRWVHLEDMSNALQTHELTSDQVVERRSFKPSRPDS